MIKKNQLSGSGGHPKDYVTSRANCYGHIIWCTPNVHYIFWDPLWGLTQIIGAAQFFFKFFLRIPCEKISSVRYRYGLD